MAFPMTTWLANERGDTLLEEVLRILESEGIEQIIDISLLTDGTVSELTRGNPEAATLLASLRSRAAEFKDGWALGAISKARRLVAAPSSLPAINQHTPLSTPSSPSSLTSSSIRTLSVGMRAFTRSACLGSGIKRARPPISTSPTLQGLKGSEMKKAVNFLHSVFLEFAGGSPRMKAVAEGPEAMREMQLEVYRMGSKSHRVVAQRGRAARIFFLDVLSYKWTLGRLTPFQVATWVQSMVSGSLKSAGARAAATLRCVQFATEWRMHLKHPLVLGQIRSGTTALRALEPPKPAVTPSVDLMGKLEKLIETGSTAQVRCMAGFCVLLGFSSARCSDALGSRNLELGADAIMGEALMKNKSKWTKFFCNRFGLLGDWASLWLHELNREGLPCNDFVLYAPCTSFDGWSTRIAEYHDVRRALHFMLHMELGMPMEEAVTFNPHSFRHFLVVAGQQLRSLNVLGPEDLEKLGHWARGSNMPNTYDTTAGVSELKARCVILDAFRRGWAPSLEGELPKPIPEVPPRPRLLPVAYSKTRNIHLRREDMSVSLCTYWSCGKPGSPSEGAIFDDIPADWGRCQNCIRKSFS